MAPILYMTPPSPPARAVMMTAEALGVELELKICNVIEKEQFTQEYLKMNPSHTVPTLDDDGFYLFESAAIMAYLADKYGKDDSLYPKDIKKRATVNQLLHFSTQSLTTFLYISRPTILFSKKKSTITEENVNRLFENIEILEKIIGDKEFVTGDKLTIADLSFVSWISTVEIIYPIEESRFPNIIRWWEKLEKLPCYKINVKGLEQFANVWISRV